MIVESKLKPAAESRMSKKIERERKRATFFLVLFFKQNNVFLRPKERGNKKLKRNNFYGCYIYIDVFLSLSDLKNG